MSSSKNDYNPGWKEKATECYAKWDKMYYLWKSFRTSQYNLLKVYVGLALFGNPSQEEQDLRDIWYKFQPDQRELIAKLTDKFKFESDYVVVGHTYLYLDKDCPVCVFRQMKSNNDIIFIDCNGRVYTSWDHFLETNQLPDCYYFAPNDGLHKINQVLYAYRSPAASKGTQALQKVDALAAGCSIAGGALMVLTVAPVSAVILGTIGAVYSVGRSIGVLADRNDHEESIGFDNAEAFLSWLNIATSAVSGASSLALSKSAQIVGKSGSLANVAKLALKGFSYAALTANVCNFGTYVYLMQRKVTSGEELTPLDLLEGCVNLFLFAGAVSNTRQMNKYINSLKSAPKTTGVRLTRTAKRRLQRSRAKLRANGGTIPVNNADVKQVTTLEENISSWGWNFMLNAGQQFVARHIFVEHIYDKCLEIWYTCFDFWHKKIGLVAFASNMMQHAQNLYILVTDALVSIKAKLEPFLKQYFPLGVPSSIVNPVSQMVENTTRVVTQIDETLIEDEEEQQSSENQSKLNYEIIFEAAKNRIPQTTQTSEIICAFSVQLSSLISEITVELNDNYEEWVSKNTESLGKTEADKSFSELGMKTLNDFANLNFVLIMKTKNQTVEANRNMVNEEIMRKVLTLYKTLLSKVAPQNTLSVLGVLETCKLLEKSLTEVFNPLGEKYKSAKKLYEINVPFVGSESAINMVFTSLKVNSNRSRVINDSTFFDIAAEKLCLDKIVQELSAAIIDEKSKNKISSQLSDQDVHSTVLFLCDNFYREVQSKLNITSIAEREGRVKDCYHFFMLKFIDLIQNTVEKRKTETSDFLKLHDEKFFDRQKFVSVYRKTCETIKHEMFASVVEYFTQEKNLTRLSEEYIATCKVFNNFFVPVCTEINKEGWIRVYSIDEGSFLNLSAYKRKAASLFDLNENQMELIRWEKGAVILKCGDHKNVEFQTVDVKSMIVMEIDMSKEPASN